MSPFNWMLDILKILLSAAIPIFIAVVGYRVVVRGPGPESAPQVIVEEAKRTFADFVDAIRQQTAARQTERTEGYVERRDLERRLNTPNSAQPGGQLRPQGYTEGEKRDLERLIDSGR